MVKIRVKLEHETRTIEHVSVITISPDDDDTASLGAKIDTEETQDGGYEITVREMSEAP